MSVAGHRKKYILEEDEPIEKKGIYVAWDEDNYIVMSWIMNSVESHIAPTIAYYTKAKEMWSFLRKTYTHATNIIKILQLEEELCNIRHGDQDLSQYFATLIAAYERLKALRPPCQHCYASHYETGMVAKFLSGLSPEYSVAKSQILTGNDLPDLADTYNRLSHLAVTLSKNTHDIPVSALVISGGWGPSSYGGTRGPGAGRSRFQCSYCGKVGHLEDHCWDKHPHLRSSVSSRRGGGRIATGKGSSSTQAAHSMATISMVESSTDPSISMSYSPNLSKDEYDRVLAQRFASTSANAIVIDSAFSVGTPTDDSAIMVVFCKLQERVHHARLEDFLPHRHMENMDEEKLDINARRGTDAAFITCLLAYGPPARARDLTSRATADGWQVRNPISPMLPTFFHGENGWKGDSFSCHRTEAPLPSQVAPGNRSSSGFNHQPKHHHQIVNKRKKQ
ncbi:hypothetical protein EJ110_NYTH10030 [Nymphaea thermarum]|nr:hypothetical protein EJ110_NYTH10030 [Nymphaea thermarum]